VPLYFQYARREEPGVQTPAQTLKQRTGSCRDFALLMMEAARRLGFATRFVSGYLYDPSLDSGNPEAGETVGAGVTHAWLQAFLPGAGWVAFDPTNNMAGGKHLIRVGVARDPGQASPISGSWFGAPNAYLGMTVAVQVRRLTTP
jgi:transglutaminase-like putative cysteine protease